MSFSTVLLILHDCKIPSMRAQSICLRTHDKCRPTYLTYLVGSWLLDMNE